MPIKTIMSSSSRQRITFLIVLWTFLPVVLLLLLQLESEIIPLCDALSLQQPPVLQKSRRVMLQDCAAAATVTVSSWLLLLPIESVQAKEDCIKDCLANCKLIAPKDPNYCQDNCNDYCMQPDRTDGLSGSVSAASGEVGLLGGTFGQGTVVKGQDKPPSVSIPGLDFLSSKEGRQLIGY